MKTLAVACSAPRPPSRHPPRTFRRSRRASPPSPRASRSTVGVGLRDLASGETVLVHGREHFPMFSVYKLPIAMSCSSAWTRAPSRLDDAVTIEPKDVRPGVSTAVTRGCATGTAP